MSFSIEFCHPIEQAVDLLKSKLFKINITITKEVEINKGAGLKLIGICKGQAISLVLYFNRSKGFSSKIVFEKFPPEEIPQLEIEFENKKNETSKPIPIHATIIVNDSKIRQAIKEGLTSSNLGAIDTKKTEHMEYAIKLQHDGHEVTLTQFFKGALVIQGAYSALIDKVVDIIDQIKPLSLNERALLFLPVEAQHDLREEISKKTNLIDIERATANTTDEDWESFLFKNDFKTLATGNTLIEILEKQTKQLPEYNFLVAIYAKVFEGFLIKILINKNFFTLEKYNENPNIANIGNTLRNQKLKKYIKDQRRHGYILEMLISVWEGARCKEMHSDPAANMQILSVSSLTVAKDKIGEIKSCMKEAYEIIIKIGLSDSTISVPSNTQNFAAAKIESNPPVFTNDQGYIGTDESGKGDYFGPLVIAGVYLDPDTEKKLTSVGVRDSKKLSDTRIFEYAKMIRSFLKPKQYSVVPIGPEKYNELYSKIGNLNKLLAWGHARAIENILSGVSCEKAIADQFGDASFIQNALMSKGKKVDLIQMPKAEQYTAVAAASVLAREGFLIKLSELGKMIGIGLPKGASQEVENTARKIVINNGFDALNKLVKLHFKTTEKLR